MGLSLCVRETLGWIMVEARRRSWLLYNVSRRSRARDCRSGVLTVLEVDAEDEERDLYFGGAQSGAKLMLREDGMVSGVDVVRVGFTLGSVWL